MGEVRAQPQPPRFRPEGGASFPPPLQPPPLGYLGPGCCRRRRRCGVSVSDTCFAEKPPPPALPELSLQPPPPPGPENAPAPDPPLGPRQLPVPAAPAAPPCSSQPPLANRRRCRRRRQDSDCLRQPGTGWLRPAPRPRPLCTGHAPPGRPAFLRPPAPPPCLAPPPLYRPVAVRAWMCAAAWGRLLCTAGRPL